MLLALTLAIALLPGLGAPASARAVAASSPALAPAAAARSTATAATPCHRKKRAAARKACRKAQRAREAAARRARVAALNEARATRARSAVLRAAATRARSSASAVNHARCSAKKRHKVRRACHREVRHRRARARRAAASATTAARRAETARRAAVALVGRPPRRYVVPSGSYFNYPNRAGRAEQAIRSMIVTTIRSTWGGPRDGRVAWAGNGTIRVTTWSFNDWKIAKALVAAHRRGVSVQVIAARSANREHRPWHWLRDRLGNQLVHPSMPRSAERVSFARQCRGSCRGRGGASHAKYLLFDKVGRTYARNVVVQTSANLTRMGWQGQWNQAQVLRSPGVYRDFLSVFRQARPGGRVKAPYHTAALGNVVNYFFPRPRARASEDPVMHVLSGVRCKGATSGGNRAGRTKIRIVQYALHGDRGVWIAKRLRRLWRGGCDIRMIYSVISRPALAVLRHGGGRGPIPLRQSLLLDRWGWVKGYNHGKWMTITGRWGSSTAAYMTFSGSANWSNAAFSNDEQMQLVRGRTTARDHLASFRKTWRQRSSLHPGRSVSWRLKIA